jgi:hypothetical protein
MGEDSITQLLARPPSRRRNQRKSYNGRCSGFDGPRSLSRTDMDAGAGTWLRAFAITRLIDASRSITADDCTRRVCST